VVNVPVLMFSLEAEPLSGSELWLYPKRETEGGLTFGLKD